MRTDFMTRLRRRHWYFLMNQKRRPLSVGGQTCVMARSPKDPGVMEPYSLELLRSESNRFDPGPDAA